MKTAFLAVALFATSALAQIDDVVLRNADGNLGKCEVSEDLGNWGYVPNSVSAEQNGDFVELKVVLLNLSCGESLDKSKAPVEWTLNMPAPSIPKNKDGEEMTFLGVNGVLHGADGYWAAQITPTSPIQPIPTFVFEWQKPGLDKALKSLKEGQTYQLSLIFYQRSLYREDRKEQKPRLFQSFGGKYAIDLTWTKSAGQLILRTKTAAHK